MQNNDQQISNMQQGMKRRIASPLSGAEVCPKCGGSMIVRRKLDFSIADLVGASLVVAVLIGVLVLIIANLSGLQLVLSLMLLGLIVAMVAYGGVKELSKPSFHSGMWAGAWVIGGFMFAALSVVRYFVRFEVIRSRVCSSCGYHIKE